MKRREIKTDIYSGHCKKYQNALALFTFTRKFTSRWQSKSLSSSILKTINYHHILQKKQQSIPAIKVMSVSWFLSRYVSILLRLVLAWCAERKQSSWAVWLDKLWTLPPSLELIIPCSEWLKFGITRKMLMHQITQTKLKWMMFDKIIL